MNRDLSTSKILWLSLIILLASVMAACAFPGKPLACKSTAWDIQLANKIARERNCARYISLYYAGGASYKCIIREIDTDSVRVVVQKYTRSGGVYNLDTDEQLVAVPISIAKDVVGLWESVADHGTNVYEDAVSEGDSEALHYVVASGRMAGGYRLLDLYGVGGDLAMGVLYDSDKISQIGPLWVHVANADVIAKELAWRTGDMTLIRRAIVEQRD